MDYTKRIGVLMGGTSSEREVSLKSGKAVYEALRSRGLNAVEVDIRREDEGYIRDLLLSYDLDLAFVVLHGGFGEDGRMQKILKELNLPFTGSGPEASCLAMDKVSSRKIFREAGLYVPKCCVLDKRHKKIDGLASFPLVVKPAGGGSSIGLSIADSQKSLRDAVSLAFKYDDKVIVEEYIDGREMTVGILEDMPLSAIEIKPKRKFFDYRAKYEKGQTDYVIPAVVPQRTMRLLKGVGLKAHKLLGCYFFSRVDMILDKEKRPYVLELNTIPGFTATSLLPMAASVSGVLFSELILKICESGFTRRDRNYDKKKS